MRSHQVLAEITPDQQYQWGYILVYNVSPNGHESTVTFEETKKKFLWTRKIYSQRLISANRKSNLSFLVKINKTLCVNFLLSLKHLLT